MSGIHKNLSLDTLLQVVHKGRRKYPRLGFLSPRELLQTVRLSNPNATITYNEVIRLSYLIACFHSKYGYFHPKWTILNIIWKKRNI